MTRIPRNCPTAIIKATKIVVVAPVKKEDKYRKVPILGPGYDPPVYSYYMGEHASASMHI